MKYKPPNLYTQVVEITREYLGPAADRFISRQIENHLNKKPEKLKRSDLKELIVWISLAMNLLIADKKLVLEYMEHLKKLCKEE